MSEAQPVRPADGPDEGSAHLSPDLLRAYMDRPLAEGPRGLVEAHLQDCSTCRSQLFPLTGDETAMSRLWVRIDRATDEPSRSLLERCALRVGVPEDAARLSAAMPSLRWSWWGGAALLLLLAVVFARLSESNSASLAFFALEPALSALAVVAVTGQRFDPAYVWLAVSPLNGFRVVLLRAAVVQVLSLAMSSAGAVGLPLPFPHMLGWLIPSLMLTAVCLALMSRMDAVPAIILTLTAWAIWLVFAYSADLPAGTRLLLPTSQMIMAAVAVLACGVLAFLRDGFDTFDNKPGGTAPFWLSTTGTRELA
ncbi:zf-HC2 domain-containing protein [Streptomyces albipurpureus]|uniref:Zf-HC2 domain-containing protein n=1 Tax=Streptomyces albipurpureus TaxID=2897419 RepID=A0ABT0UJX2_9ACTN|nr:zf-HC2 domain-containing protein [Streptomyces sp. CWNU-1]MCM2388917.1 zf-HC2 domain-containing protein [Streptomyces sp. CWNU-1]